MTIPTIILYIVCFGLVVAHYFAIRQDQRQEELVRKAHRRLGDMETHMKDIERMHKRLHDQCVETSKAYIRLEARVSVLERKGQ